MVSRLSRFLVYKHVICRKVPQSKVPACRLCLLIQSGPCESRDVERRHKRQAGRYFAAHTRTFSPVVGALSLFQHLRLVYKEKCIRRQLAVYKFAIRFVILKVWHAIDRACEVNYLFGFHITVCAEVHCKCPCQHDVQFYETDLACGGCHLPCLSMPIERRRCQPWCDRDAVRQVEEHRRNP